MTDLQEILEILQTLSQPTRKEGMARYGQEQQTSRAKWIATDALRELTNIKIQARLQNT